MSSITAAGNAEALKCSYGELEVFELAAGIRVINDRLCSDFKQIIQGLGPCRDVDWLRCPVYPLQWTP